MVFSFCFQSMHIIGDEHGNRLKMRKQPATRNMRRTPRIPHDRRRTLRTWKRMESEHRPGGAVGHHAPPRQDGRPATAAPFRCHRHGGNCEPATSTIDTSPSSIQKSTPTKEMCSHDSSPDSPSGAFSPHTWHDSPHPSGSSEHRQIVRPQQIAANDMKHMATSAIQLPNLPFLFTAANIPYCPPPYKRK